MFHIVNSVNAKFVSDKPFQVRLKIGDSYEAGLVLRPLGGDIFILYEVLMGKCYSVPKEFLPPDDVRVIIDCGANVGITALFLASRYPKAIIYSIEPHPKNFAILKMNTHSEPRIVPVNAAVVGYPQESVRLSVNQSTWGNRVVSSNNYGIDVPALTVSQICERYDLKSIDLLKIDIEGAEEEVFENADSLPQVRFGLIELHGNFTLNKFEQALARLGYDIISPDESTGLQMLAFSRPVA